MFGFLFHVVAGDLRAVSTLPKVANQNPQFCSRERKRAVSEAWQLQRLLGGHCHAPLTSEAWSEISVGEVFDVRIDMCSVGMRCPKTNVPVKPTRIMITMKELADRLSSCRCDHKHGHAHLEGKFKNRNLSSWCEIYPK